MEPSQGWSAQAVTNFVGGFWRHVRRTLHPEKLTRRSILERDMTIAWINGEPMTDLPEAPTFVEWCRMGGIELDPDAWRETLLAGVVPVDGLPLKDR